MIKHSLTNEELLFNHILRASDALIELEFKWHNIIVSARMDNMLENRNTYIDWCEHYQLALWNFVKSDSFWKKQSVIDQVKFVALSTIKMEINTELFLEPLYS